MAAGTARYLNVRKAIARQRDARATATSPAFVDVRGQPWYRRLDCDDAPVDVPWYRRVDIGFDAPADLPSRSLLPDPPTWSMHLFPWLCRPHAVAQRLCLDEVATVGPLARKFTGERWTLTWNSLPAKWVCHCSGDAWQAAFDVGACSRRPYYAVGTTHACPVHAQSAPRIDASIAPAAAAPPSVTAAL